MKQEILDLIDMALADGEITEKKREIVFRKADELGEDRDVVEMYLEGKIAKLKNQSSNNDNVSTEVKPVETSTEQYNVHALFQKLEDAEGDRSNVKDTLVNAGSNMLSNAMRSGFSKKESLDHTTKRKVEIISSFPLPTMKNDVIEFLALVVPKAKQVIGMFPKAKTDSEKAIGKAFLQKSEQILIQAKLKFKDDYSLMTELQGYAAELKLKF
jgi:hypothetical protein